MKNIPGFRPKTIAQTNAASSAAEVSRQAPASEVTAPKAPAAAAQQQNEAAGAAAKAALRALALDTPAARRPGKARGAAAASLGARIAQLVPAKTIRRATAAAAVGLSVMGSTPACLAGTVYAPEGAPAARATRSVGRQNAAPMSVRDALLSSKQGSMVADALGQASLSPNASVVAGLSTAELGLLRNPKLEAADVVAARDGLEALRREISSRSVRRGVAETPLSAVEMAALRRDVESLNELPPVPNSVAGKRQWIATNGPKIEKGKLAAFTLKMDAFFVDKSLEAESKAANKLAANADALLTRTEEQAGLRAPKAPLDPNRPFNGLQKGLDTGSQNNPVVRAISPLLRPVMVVGDVMDYVTRGAQRDAYPEQMREYEARVAEYERARQQ